MRVLKWVGNVVGLGVWLAIVYAVCVRLFHWAPSTAYTIMAVIAVVGVISWFIPKKKKAAPEPQRRIVA